MGDAVVVASAPTMHGGTFGMLSCYKISGSHRYRCWASGKQSSANRLLFRVYAFEAYSTQISAKLARDRAALNTPKP